MMMRMWWSSEDLGHLGIYIYICRFDCFVLGILFFLNIVMNVNLCIYLNQGPIHSQGFIWCISSADRVKTAQKQNIYIGVSFIFNMKAKKKKTAFFLKG